MEKSKKRSIKQVVMLIVAFFLVVNGQIAIAINEVFDNDAFTQNDILFYDPRPVEEDNGGGGGWDGIVGECKFEEKNNKTYDGKRQIFTKSQLDKIAEYSPVYKEAGEKHDIPWQMLAVIHIRESGQRITNPANGQGIYQLYSWAKNPKKNGFLKMNFKGQTIVAAEYLKGKNQFLTRSSDANQIKETFFAFNGKAQVYIRQARNLGFDENGAKIGEGSPYVMNMADEKRDPDKNGSKWGQIKVDGGKISYPANRDPGAFVMYKALTGIAPDGACRDKEINPNPDTNLNIIGNKADKIRVTAVGMSYKNRNQAFGKPNDLYKKGLAKNNLYGHNGKDCGVFAGVVMRYSGVDENFPIRDTFSQHKYLKSNTGEGKKYVEIKNTGNIGVLRPGDILVVPRRGDKSGHIIFYVGAVAGSYSNNHLKADASLSSADGTGGRVGGLYPIDQTLMHQTSGRYFSIFRIRD